MGRAIDIVKVKAEIAAGKLAAIAENGNVLLKDMQSGEAVKIATLPQPSNEAMTLEELRGMDGVNALWVHDLAWGLHKPRLMLVHGITEDWWTCCDFNGFETFNADDYGDRYLLYRRPPEGEIDGTK